MLGSESVRLKRILGMSEADYTFSSGFIVHSWLECIQFITVYSLVTKEVLWIYK